MSNAAFFKKTFLVFLAPMMLSNMLQSLFGTVNSAYLGRMIGIEGVWMAYPITFTSMCLLQMGYYLLIWRRQTIRRLI